MKYIKTLEIDGLIIFFDFVSITNNNLDIYYNNCRIASKSFKSKFYIKHINTLGIRVMYALREK